MLPGPQSSVQSLTGAAADRMDAQQLLNLRLTRGVLADIEPPDLAVEVAQVHLGNVPRVGGSGGDRVGLQRVLERRQSLGTAAAQLSTFSALPSLPTLRLSRTEPVPTSSR